MNKKLSFDKLIGKKTLILGEIGSGKSRLLAELIGQCILRGLSEETTILDFAPQTITINNWEVGGKISNLVALPANLNYISPDGIEYPRLKAESAEEMISISKRNASLIEEALNDFIRKPTKNVFINEVSLFFHFGSIDRVEEALKKAETAALTSYYGFMLEDDLGTGLCRREKMVVEALIEDMDITVYLPPPRGIFEDYVPFQS